MKIIQLPATVTSYKDKVDGSSSISLASRELSDEEILLLRRFRGAEGWFLFSPNKVSEEEIPKGDAPIEGKSHSQRLMNVMYLVWKQVDGVGDFETWRRIQMEKLITLYKNKLD